MSKIEIEKLTQPPVRNGHIICLSGTSQYRYDYLRHDCLLTVIDPLSPFPKADLLLGRHLKDSPSYILIER